MIENLRSQFKRYTERLDALSLRERGIIFVAIMVAIYSIAANVLFPPLNTEQARLKKEIAAKRTQTQAFETQIQAALAKSAEDPDAANRARLAELEKQLKSIEESLGAITSRLVPPKEMTRMVEQILARNRRLEVVRMESLPAEPLRSAGDVPQGLPKGAAAAKTLTAYRHGMRIELKGEYLDVLAYLRELEELPWKVFWGQISLQTEQYPVSRVVLHIYTLSTREGVIAI